MPQELKSYHLIQGDLSGIQPFIFNVQSTNAARALKGRSFFLKVLMEVARQKIFDDFRVHPAKRKNAEISTSGGNFILEVQTDSLNILDDIQNSFTQALQYSGLNLVLAGVKFDPQNYSKALKDLNQATREQKFKLYQEDASFFKPFDRQRVTDLFNSSRNNKSKEKWLALTDLIRTSSCFKIQKKTKTSNGILNFTHRGICLAGYEVIFGNTGIDVNKYLESQIPIRENNPATFANLVREKGQEGIAKLGILNMDVDNLGSALEQVQTQDEHEKFDNTLRFFFNEELSEILDKNQFKNKVYVVTAGGDDSFFVGRWNVMLSLAKTIRNKFSQNVYFQEHNLTISAGLIMVDEKFPVVRFAYLAEEALKDAKYRYDGKGNISLFGEVITWDDFNEKVIPLKKEFQKLGKKFSSGLLTKSRLLSYRVAYQKGLKLSDFWKIGYYFRDANQKVSTPILNKYNNYLTQAIAEADKRKRQSLKLVFPVAARLAEFYKRKH